MIKKNSSNIMKGLVFRLYVLIVFLFTSELVNGQQFPQYTQYNYNMNIINPAYAGLKQNTQINILARSQWTGVEGAPTTGTLVIDSALKENWGIGFSAIYDQLGPVKETQLYADFSHTLQISQLGKLSLGLKAGFAFQNLNTSLLNFDQEELVALNDVENTTSPNFGFGLYYNQEEFYVGFSVPNVLSLSFSENNIDAIGTVVKETAFYLSSGYFYTVSDNLVLKPSFLLRVSTDFPTLLDLSTTAYFNKKFELGLAYRTNKTISLATVLAANEFFKIGYAYEYTLGELSAFNNGSHEIILSFNLQNRQIRDKGRYFYYF